jgi:transcriptional regulator with XRE-family HTH domain
MANRIRIVEQAQRRATRQRLELGIDLREARLAAGLRQRDVGKALGWSHSRVGRIERGLSQRVTFEDLALVAACVGLSFNGRFFPAAGRLRDIGQLSMINRYRELVAPGRWLASLEAPVGLPGDQRAFDLLLVRGSLRVMHEFITRLRDVQAQVRRLTVKQADAGEARLVLVIAATHANRRAVAEAGGALLDSFPLSTKAVLRALRAGIDPGGNGIVFI